MPDDVQDVAAVAESASDDAVSEAPESTSEEQSDVDETAESEAEAEGEAEAESESDGTETVEAQGDDEDPEYRNLVAKFKHIINPRDRNAAIAKAYWDKTNYASQVRKENEELKAKLARVAPDEPKKDEPPPPPPADLEKATKKIEALYQRGQEIEARHTNIVKELNAADRELAIAEDRLKDVSEDDDRRPLAVARVRQAKLELESVRERWTNNNDRRDALNERLEQAMAERDWIERFHKDQTQRQTTEQKRHEQFNTEFPQQVQGLAHAAAKHIGLSLDDKLSASMWRHVNLSLQADIGARFSDADLEEIPVPDLVLGYVKEWAEDRELVKRKSFTETSKAKLAVAAPATKPGDRKAPAPAGKPAPASSRPAVPPALLSNSSSPVMAKARKLLIARLGGGA